jgi:acetolactate decarboxylase
MRRVTVLRWLFLTGFLSALLHQGFTQRGVEVIATGAMQEVMREGRLAGRLDLDTLSDRLHLTGVGPLEYLRGELLLFDGKCYVARIGEQGQIRVDTLWEVRAPFFVHARVPRWEARPLPAHVTDLAQLESFLDHLAGGDEQAFPFRLAGRVEEARIHVLDLHPGTVVRSPQDVALSKKGFFIRDESVEMIGFFSRHHQSVFTHHDSYLHLHLITADRSRMGHLDALQYSPGSLTLYLPARE